MMLRLSDDLSIGVDAVTQTFGLLAMRGAGKTNAARVMAEEMFAARLPFVAVDPVGSWWGLRSNRDGTGPGLAIPIFGGKHGDVPLERSGGNLIADLVVDERLSCVLDLTGFDSEASKKAFLLDFARRLYQRNEAPLHLFLEEADDYIPQRPMREEAQLLRAWENIVRRGRARGLGITLITQRSASINKNVLTQVETLIALRTTSPNDRAVIEDWLKYHDQGKAAATLASLANGEAWLWSPQWLGKTELIRFRLSHTFDSGATPKMTKAGRAPATLADVDLKSVADKMAATIERAKADDPKELRKRITELEKQVKSFTASAGTPVDHVPLAKYNEMHEAWGRDQDEREAARLKTNKALDRVITELRTDLEKVVSLLNSDIRACDTMQKSIAESVYPAAIRLPAAAAARRPAPIMRGKVTASMREPASGLTPTKVQQRILDALAWYESLGNDNPTAIQVGAVALIDTTGGYFSNVVGPLSAGGFVARHAGRLALTDAGRMLANIPDEVATLSDYHEVLRRRVRQMKSAGGKTIEILDVIIAAGPGAVMSSQQIGEAISVDHSGGYFSNIIGPLSTAGLITRASGSVIATDILFPDGLSRPIGRR